LIRLLVIIRTTPCAGRAASRPPACSTTLCSPLPVACHKDIARAGCWRAAAWGATCQPAEQWSRRHARHPRRPSETIAYLCTPHYALTACMHRYGWRGVEGDASENRSCQDLLIRALTDNDSGPEDDPLSRTPSRLNSSQVHPTAHLYTLILRAEVQWAAGWVHGRCSWHTVKINQNRTCPALSYAAALRYGAPCASPWCCAPLTVHALSDSIASIPGAGKQRAENCMNPW